MLSWRVFFPGSWFSVLGVGGRGRVWGFFFLGMGGYGLGWGHGVDGCPLLFGCYVHWEYGCGDMRGGSRRLWIL